MKPMDIRLVVRTVKFDFVVSPSLLIRWANYQRYLCVNEPFLATPGVIRIFHICKLMENEFTVRVIIIVVIRVIDIQLERHLRISSVVTHLGRWRVIPTTDLDECRYCVFLIELITGQHRLQEEYGNADCKGYRDDASEHSLMCLLVFEVH